MAEKQKTAIGNSITEGAIWKQLLFFFFPILFGTMFQQLYNTVDMIIVGRFVGTQALASVGGSAAAMINLIVGFFTGLSAGAGVVISQYFGAGDHRGVKRAIHTAYAFSIVGGILFTAIGILLSPTILRVTNTPEDVLASSTLYLRIYFAGILFVFIFNIGSGILRALGNSRLPLYYLIVCSVANIVLDMAFVVLFQMGVAGVAIATLLAQALSTVLVTRKLMSADDSIALRLRDIRFDPLVLRSQLHIGIPGGLQSTMYSLSNIIVQTSVNIYGTAVVAAWATDGKIESLFWMVSGAFGVAITTFVGQNYGAGKWDRIRKGTLICLLMYQAVSVFLSIVFVSFAGPLFRIFTTDEDVIAYGIQIIETVVPYYIAFSFIEVLSSSLRGISDVMIPMFLTMMGVCVLRICWILFVVPRNPSIHLILVNYPLTWIVTGVFFIIYFLYRMKTRMHA